MRLRSYGRSVRPREIDASSAEAIDSHIAGPSRSGRP
jgi:hypothetical protein